MPSVTDIADFLAPLSEGSNAPEWVHLLPLGDVRGRDGRYWRLDSPAKVIQHFRQESIDLPVDYEHQTTISQTNGQPAPAAGWIKRLELRADGVWGAVQWTDRARQMIVAKEYRFLSPVFQFNRHNRQISFLQSASLTNVPNLYLTALARREDLTMANPSPLIAIANSLKLPEKANEAEILAAIETLRSSPDPTKFVPVEQVQALVAELNALKSQTTDETAANRVDLAMHQGRLPPVLRDWGIALCRQNRTAFDDFVAKSPLRLAEETRFPSAIPGSSSGAIGESESAVCRNLGISKEDFRKNRVSTS